MREKIQICAAVMLVLAVGLACKRKAKDDETPVINTPSTVETSTATTTAPTTTATDTAATATATATTTATTASATGKTFKVGDKINVIWNGATYPATVLAVLPNDKYKIHYTGWGSNWDETVGLDRIVGSGVGATKPTATATARATGGGGGGTAADAPCPGPGITRRCNGVCVNLQTDDNNCGSCGTKCPSGKHCDGHLFCRDAEGNL